LHTQFTEIRSKTLVVKSVTIRTPWHSKSSLRQVAIVPFRTPLPQLWAQQNRVILTGYLDGSTQPPCGGWANARVPLTGIDFYSECLPVPTFLGTGILAQADGLRSKGKGTATAGNGSSDFSIVGLTKRQEHRRWPFSHLK
jgi:hypothetical protein